jgi:hypothetical protein
VVSLDHWREELKARGIIDPTDANPRMTFKRIKEGLAARQIIGERNSQVWLANG